MSAPVITQLSVMNIHVSTQYEQLYIIIHISISKQSRSWAGSLEELSDQGLLYLQKR